MRKRAFVFVWLLLVIPCQAQAACVTNIPGDISGDCKVDLDDFAMLASDWLKAGQPHEWVARYNGPGNSSDRAYAIVVDSNDNIYVTGSTVSATGKDCATIKYSPDSNQPLWVARYNGPSNSADEVHAIAVDSNDNVYVTGYSQGDCATIKYSPDSNQPVWVARYNGPGNSTDEAWAIAVDSNDNIYVTGVSRGSGTNDDYATIKYFPDSNQPVWVARYNGPANSIDRAYAITVDSNDNIYVTGSGVGSGTESDYTTIKYSPDSNQPVWVARYDGPDNSTDLAQAIAVDSKDNIYVTGYSQGDCATIKYSPDSNQPLWVARYSSGMALAIAVDSNDNIYVAGYSESPGGFSDYITIKYSPDSNQAVWVARYNGPDYGLYNAWAITVDSKDNIYVTGGRWGEGPFATIKYSPDSNQPVWVAIYNGPYNGSNEGKAITVDSNDNIYVAGYSESPGVYFDYITIKYSPDYTCTPPVTGDINHDCEVDIYDLRIFCRNWLESNL